MSHVHAEQEQPMPRPGSGSSDSKNKRLINLLTAAKRCLLILCNLDISIEFIMNLFMRIDDQTGS